MELKQGQHAFITGAASGIGYGIAQALAKRGINITIADIDQESLDAVEGTLSSPHLCVRLDVRDEGSWRKCQMLAEESFGPVDILINNAGIGFDGRDVVDTSAQSLSEVVAINLVGVQNGLTTVGASMRERGTGHIVNTASVMGVLPGVPGMGAYSASKAAVVALTEALRGELAAQGIGVSVLCPGLVTSRLRENTIKLGGVVAQTVDERYVSKCPEMAPVTAGEIVAQGITDNLPYLLTHGHYLPAVQGRADALSASANAAESMFRPE